MHCCAWLSGMLLMVTDQNWYIAQKRQKLLKHSKNSLEKLLWPNSIFEKSDQIFFLLKTFSIRSISSENTWNQVIFALKHQIRLNSTKTEKRSNTSKTGRNQWKHFWVILMTLNAKKSLLNKKTFLTRIIQNAFCHSNVAQKQPTWTNSTKTKSNQKRQKLLKVTDYCSKIHFAS